MTSVTRIRLTTHTLRAIAAKGKKAAAAGEPRRCPYAPTSHTEKLRLAWFSGWDSHASERTSS